MPVYQQEVYNPGSKLMLILASTSSALIDVNQCGSIFRASSEFQRIGILIKAADGLFRTIVDLMASGSISLGSSLKQNRLKFLN